MRKNHATETEGAKRKASSPGKYEKAPYKWRARVCMCHEESVRMCQLSVWVSRYDAAWDVGEWVVMLCARIKRIAPDESSGLLVVLLIVAERKLVPGDVVVILIHGIVDRGCCARCRGERGCESELSNG